MFWVQHLSNNAEVFECLEEKVIRVYGKVHVTNYAFTLCLCMYTDNWKSDDLILAITNTPEKYHAYIQRALAQANADIMKMQKYGISVKGSVDLKFTNEILNLNACLSTFARAFCQYPTLKYLLVDLDFVWKKSDLSFGELARFGNR